jgi:selenide,water dikinase
MESIRLTQYSHGAGCGCKIAPGVLSQILAGHTAAPNSEGHARLLVGNDARDDAAAYDLGDGRALISTTDFFMPIVDDPHDFGYIAAANALSDVYAMGGTPALAIALLGWPISKLPPEVAGQVLAGGRAACGEAGIALAGGHSIDSPEPIFGLAVNGLVPIRYLKRNATARAGDRLYLTKALGVGILATAEKRGLLAPEHVGVALGEIGGVRALTDVTGFGLLGHLVEMTEGSGLAARVDGEAVRLLPGADAYREAGAIPGGSRRNWASYGEHVAAEGGAELAERWQHLLADPQTSGGLLAAVAPEACGTVEALLREHGPEDAAAPIGELARHEGGARIVVRG